jgi:hypothetical protein
LISSGFFPGTPGGTGRGFSSGLGGDISCSVRTGGTLGSLKTGGGYISRDLFRAMMLTISAIGLQIRHPTASRISRIKKPSMGSAPYKAT